MARGPLPPGNPGRDMINWRQRMAQLLKRVATDDDVLEVWEHVTDMAKTSNDIQWATLFLAYTIGRPSSQDPQQQIGGVQVDGDLTLTINSLSPEQLKDAEAALKTIDATFSPVAIAAPDAH